MRLPRERKHDDDSSDEEDNIPLGQTLAMHRTGRNASPSLPTAPPTAEPKAAELHTTLTPAPEPVPASESSAFDDAFGLSSPAGMLPPPPSSKTGPIGSRRGSPKDARPTTLSGTGLLGDTLSPTESKAPPSTEPAKSASSNLNSDLDVAFGGNASRPSLQIGTQPETFTFQSTFDDTFDFNTSSALKAEPQRSPSLSVTAAGSEQTNGHALKSDVTGTSFHTPQSSPHTDAPGGTWPNVPARKEPLNAIETAFDIPPSSSESKVATQQATSTSSYQPLSFDDAFATPNIPALKTPGEHASPTNTSTSNASPPPTSPAPGTKGTPQQPPEQGISQRSTSPPPRAQSPLLARLSGSPPSSPRRKKSDADGAPSRSSKLSLRLFGKNKDKKTKKASQLEERLEPSTPPSLPPRRGGSGSTTRTTDVIGSVGPDGDIQSVQTLMDMGFSRARTVEALERYNYDVTAALNSLVK